MPPPRPKSRTPSPKASLASITVPMGGIAWISSTTGDYQLLNSVGGYTMTSGKTFPDRCGMYTGGLTACFTVTVLGSGGAIMAHVSAYLGHGGLSTAHKAELKAMKDSFAYLWSAHRAALTPHTVAITPGEYTSTTQMNALIAQIFPQIAHDPAYTFPCEKTPNPRKVAHGTVVAMAGPSKELFVEDVKKL